MRKVRNADGSSRFDASSYLTSQQVASFFSRLASNPDSHRRNRESPLCLIREGLASKTSEIAVTQVPTILTRFDLEENEANYFRPN